MVYWRYVPAGDGAERIINYPPAKDANTPGILEFLLPSPLRFIRTGFKSSFHHERTMRSLIVRIRSRARCAQAGSRFGRLATFDLFFVPLSFIYR